ncbi:MAG TPA: hypothetical protein VJP07_06910 [Dehalococcoidia bacterium]|nr:hypothetical protein [Dehalococcoidia bacterium]
MQSNDDGRRGDGTRRGGTRPTGTADRPGDRRGPFDRILRTTEPPNPNGPDRAAIYVAGAILGLAILLLVLLLPPVSILSGDDDGGAPSDGPGTADNYTSTVRGSMPKLPEGLAAASAMFDLAAPQDEQGASRVTVPLKDKQTEARNLGLYTYVDGGWQRLSDITLVAGGEAARGDVSALPGNVAVLKRSKSTLQVAGILPAGATVDPRAESSLTVVHPIVFLTTPDGKLAGTPPAVPPAGYKVVPGVVTLDPNIIDDILRSSQLQATHAAQIAETVRAGNYEGINIDYRSVNPQLRTQFSTFVQLVSKALKADSRTLTLTLPMPVVTDGNIDTGAYDWDALGALADTIEVAPADLDQELYFQRAEAALDYITEHVDKTKIALAISSLSVERGSDGLRAISFDEALAIAAAVDVKSTDGITPSEQVQLVAKNLAPSEGASGLGWDDTARAVTFSYNGAGGKRTVWIANQFSVAFRLELAQRYQLGGVVISDVSVQGGPADVWSPVQQIADTGQLSLTKPNGELLVPAWTVADGAGSITPSTGTSVAWTAPAAAGSYTMTIIVSDGIDRAGQTIPLEVSAPAAPETPAE